MSQIEGRRPVVEALRAGVPLHKVYLLRDGERLGDIRRMARESGAVIVDCDRARLDALSESRNHQGVIAVAAERTCLTLDELWDKLGNDPFLVVCDGVEDPGNLGAVMRSAEAAGADGLILPKHRSAGLTAITEKASAGALSHLPVARVSNLAAALRTLKERGVWVFGAVPENATPYYQADFKGGIAIVLGSEGAGLNRLTEELCDFRVGIPMFGKVSSLNVSAAAAVLCFEAARQRTKSEPAAQGE